MKKRFQHVLKEVLEEDHPLSYSQLQVLSNLGREELDAFRQAWLTAPDERRRQVARALAQLNEDSPDMNFRDVLLLFLGDPEEVVRAAAIDGLCDDESYDLLERLLQVAVEDASADVRVQAILALGRFMYLIETTDFLGAYRQRLLQVLLEVFADDSSPQELRRRALESMSYMTTSEAVEEAISQAYEAGERGMHASAIHAMGHHMAERWQPLVERELESPDPEMRYEAALASGEMASPELVHHLAPLLEDRDHEVARAAIWALGEIGGTKARRLLERCLERDEDDIRDAAEEALHTLRFYEDPMRLF
jgi:hypothetical protein